MKCKEVYLPIEFFSRELFPKILLAIFLLKEGFTVYLGSQSSINFLNRFKKKKNGTIVLKGGIKNSTLNLYKKIFNNIVVIDEEIAPEIKNPKQIFTRVEKNLINHCSLYVCSNQGSYNYCKKNNLFSSKSKLLGWPRFDLSKNHLRDIFGNEPNKIKEKYKNFFLINSDFKYINEYVIYKEIKKIKKICKEFHINQKLLNKKIYREKLRSKQNLLEFNDFKKIINDISIKNRKFNFVLRAHPTEDYQIMQKHFCKSKNIYVLSPQDDVYPYIFASRGVLHRGCTTAYQALLSNKNIAWVYKNKSENKHKKILFQNSFKIKNEKDFKSWMNKINKRKNKPTLSFRKLLSKNINFLSSKLIAKEINKQHDQKVYFNYIFILKVRFYFFLRKLRYLFRRNNDTKNLKVLKSINLKSLITNYMKKKNIQIKILEISENLYVLRS